MREFTNEEIAMLAEQERAMDRGEVFFVVYGGNRVTVQDAAVEALKLEQGQTITDVIFRRILEIHLASTQAAIAMRNIEKSASTPPPPDAKP